MKVTWTRIGNFCKLDRTLINVDPVAIYRKAGVRSFGKGIFEYDPAPGVEIGKLRFHDLQPNRLIVSNIKAWEGAVAVTPPEESGRVVSNRFLSYRSESVSLRYLWHWLLSDQGNHALQQASPGSADRNRTLSVNAFEAIRVPLPARQTQDHIAAYLDSLARISTVNMTDCSSLINRIVLDAAADAPTKSIGSCLRRDRDWIKLGSTAIYHPIGIRGFGRGIIHYPEVGAMGLSKMRYFVVKPNDLLISNIKAWEAAVCVAGADDAGRIGSNRFLQYKPIGDQVLSRWLECYFLTDAGIHALGMASPGSADRNRTLSMEAFEAIEVPVPSLRVQEYVASVSTRAKQISDLSSIRDRLMAAILPAARNNVFSKGLRYRDDTP